MRHAHLAEDKARALHLNWTDGSLLLCKRRESQKWDTLMVNDDTITWCELIQARDSTVLSRSLASSGQLFYFKFKRGVFLFFLWPMTIIHYESKNFTEHHCWFIMWPYSLRPWKRNYTNFVLYHFSFHYWLGFKHFLLPLFVPSPACITSPQTNSYFLPQVPFISRVFAAACRLEQLTPEQTVSPWHHHTIETIIGVATSYQTHIPFSVDAACLRHAPHDLLHVPWLRARVDEDRKELACL